MQITYLLIGFVLGILFCAFVLIPIILMEMFCKKLNWGYFKKFCYLLFTNNLKEEK